MLYQLSYIGQPPDVASYVSTVTLYPGAARLYGAPTSSARTLPAQPAWPSVFADRRWWSRIKLPERRTLPAQLLNASLIPRADFRLRLAPANQNWCTGKDSNLRTSQGGTDLQSVGFNHSPTCAKTPAFVRLRQIPEPQRLCAEDASTAGNDPIEKPSARENPLARKHHTWKNSLWSAVGKNLLRRRAALNAL